jgi:bifunctional non-homologous end joining protein LigD
MTVKRELKLTNLDKIYWPDDGYTKGDLLYYYESIAPVILPYLKNRPMVMLRHPNGIYREGFFQKQVDLTHLPSWIQTIRVKHQERYVDYLAIQDLESLLYVINLGCIELNPFSSRIPNLENPDYMIIDLDPEDIAFDFVIKAALVIHDILEEINIKNYCKTSGKRGLHIFIPLGAQINFEQSQEFAKIVAFITQKYLPDIISLEHSPAKRQQRIYVDFLRNSRHQTVSSVYSLRPAPGAPASAPLFWDELKPGLNPRDFNIENMYQRIHNSGDLFTHVLDKNIDLKTSFEKLQKILISFA